MSYAPQHAQGSYYPKSAVSVPPRFANNQGNPFQAEIIASAVQRDLMSMPNANANATMPQTIQPYAQRQTAGLSLHTAHQVAPSASVHPNVPYQPPTPVTPTEPERIPQNNKVAQIPLQVGVAPELLSFVLDGYDRVMKTRLVELETSMKNLADQNASLMSSTTNVLAQLQSYVIKIDDRATETEKRLTMQSAELNGWRASLGDTLGRLVGGSTGDIVQAIKERHEIGEKHLARCINVLGHQVATLSAEQKSMSDNFTKVVQGTNAATQERLDICESRMKAMDAALSSTASAFTASSNSLSPTIPTSNSLPIVSSSQPQNLLIQTTIPSGDMSITTQLNQLSDDLKSACDKSSSNFDQLASMIDTSHALLTVRLEHLEKVIGMPSSDAPEVDDNGVIVGKGLGADIMNIATNPSTEQLQPMSLADRISSLEDRLQEAIKGIDHGSAFMPARSPLAYQEAPSFPPDFFPSKGADPGQAEADQSFKVAIHQSVHKVANVIVESLTQERHPNSHPYSADLIPNSLHLLLPLPNGAGQVPEVKVEKKLQMKAVSPKRTRSTVGRSTASSSKVTKSSRATSKRIRLKGTTEKGTKKVKGFERATQLKRSVRLMVKQQDEKTASKSKPTVTEQEIAPVLRSSTPPAATTPKATPKSDSGPQPEPEQGLDLRTRPLSPLSSIDETDDEAEEEHGVEEHCDEMSESEKSARAMNMPPQPTNGNVAPPAAASFSTPPQADAQQSLGPVSVESTTSVDQQRAPMPYALASCSVEDRRETSNGSPDEPTARSVLPEPPIPGPPSTPKRVTSASPPIHSSPNSLFTPNSATSSSISTPASSTSTARLRFVDRIEPYLSSLEDRLPLAERLPSAEAFPFLRENSEEKGEKDETCERGKSKENGESRTSDVVHRNVDEVGRTEPELPTPTEDDGEEDDDDIPLFVEHLRQRFRTVLYSPKQPVNTGLLRDHDNVPASKMNSARDDVPDSEPAPKKRKLNSRSAAPKLNEQPEEQQRRRKETRLKNVSGRPSFSPLSAPFSLPSTSNATAVGGVSASCSRKTSLLQREPSPSAPTASSSSSSLSSTSKLPHVVKPRPSVFFPGDDPSFKTGRKKNRKAELQAKGWWSQRDRDGERYLDYTNGRDPPHQLNYDYGSAVQVSRDVSAALDARSKREARKAKSKEEDQGLKAAEQPRPQTERPYNKPNSLPTSSILAPVHTTVPAPSSPAIPPPRLATIPLSTCEWPEKTHEDETFDRQLIQCDRCLNHYHCSCVGLKKGDSVVRKPKEKFICPPCHDLLAKIVNSVAQKLDPQPQCPRPDCDWRGSTDFFVIDKIIGRGLTDPDENETQRIVWLVKWSGYPVTEAVWKPADEIGDARKLIKDFHASAKKEGRTTEKFFLLREAIEGGYKLAAAV